MKTIKSKSGFTLIEVSLAIAFIGVLLLIIALLTSSIITVYQKGLATKSVNSAGRDLIDDFTTAISGSPAKDLTDSCLTNYAAGAQYNSCVSNHAYHFVFSQRYSNRVAINGVKTDDSVPLSGVFCTGQYSYIWNTGYALNPATYRYDDDTEIKKATIKYLYNGETRTMSDFRIVKFPDPTRVACSSRIKTSEKSYNLIEDSNATYDLTKDTKGVAYPLQSEPAELLAKSENALALYDFRVFMPAQDETTKHIFYSASFVLATIRGSINITTSNNYCTTPDGINSDFDYCAINKFNFAMQATGE